MKRAFKMRAYPTGGQAARAGRLLGVHCEIYNAALQERRDAWRMRRVSVSFADQSAQLKAVRESRPDVAGFSCTAQQQTLRRLNRSFDAFFRRVKAGDTAGYPRFRSRARFDTVDHRNGDGAKWVPTEGRWARAYFQGVGHLKVDEHTPVDGRVTQVSLRRENGGRRWYVIVIAETEPEPLPPAGSDVGVDVGIARFLVTSSGETVGNPRFAAEAADELAELQRRRAATKRGSGNYRRLSRRIAKLHRKTKNRRADFHHKTARRLVDTHDTIAVEDLPVANMARRAAPRPDPDQPGEFLPNGGSAKTGLNRSISDVGWAQFISILTAKAECAGRQIIKVNPAHTSDTCNLCLRDGVPAAQARVRRPRQDTVICDTHGSLDADLNAACNIADRAGLTADPAGTRAGLGSSEAASAA